MMGIKHGALGLALLVVFAACTQATADQPVEFQNLHCLGDDDTRRRT